MHPYRRSQKYNIINSNITDSGMQERSRGLYNNNNDTLNTRIYSLCAVPIHDILICSSLLMRNTLEIYDLHNIMYMQHDHKHFPKIYAKLL